MNYYCLFHVIRIISNFLTFVTRLALRYSEDCRKSIDGIRTIRNKMMKTLKKLIKKIILTWTIDIMELECASNYAGNYTYYYTNQWNQLFSARMCRFLHRWKFMCNIYLMEIQTLLIEPVRSCVYWTKMCQEENSFVYQYTTVKIKQIQ